MADRKPLPHLVHPTYGSLTEVAAEIEKDRHQGDFPRMGHIGALAWFIKRLYNTELITDEREH